MALNGKDAYKDKIMPAEFLTRKTENKEDKDAIGNGVDILEDILKDKLERRESDDDEELTEEDDVLDDVAPLSFQVLCSK